MNRNLCRNLRTKSRETEIEQRATTNENGMIPIGVLVYQFGLVGRVGYCLRNVRLFHQFLRCWSLLTCAGVFLFDVSPNWCSSSLSNTACRRIVLPLWGLKIHCREGIIYDLLISFSIVSIIPSIFIKIFLIFLNFMINIIDILKI